MMLRKLAAAIALASCGHVAYAGSITGTVNDIQGNPIAGAKVSVEGSSIQVLTDANGAYVIPNVNKKHVHLHVYSIDHVHGDQTLTLDSESVTANFQLRNTRVENVLVTANPMASSVLESTAPVTVLSGEALRKEQAPTLGETLSNVPGVHSSYFGPVASSPIIRGTDGPRVKIVQNGLDVSDASRVGPDHNIGAEASTATQIEVLRGPATLQYGSGAIGGVVNVVDQRIATELPEKLRGELGLRFDSVANENFAKLDLNGGVGAVALHLDTFSRETDDYEIPGFALAEPHEEDISGTLEGSAIDTLGYTVGASYIGDSGYLGMAYQHLDNFYGVPGHSHEEHADEEPGIEPEEESVNLDVDMDRLQLAAEWHSPFPGASSVRFRSAKTDYQHVELEGENVGTTFRNDTLENRLTMQHEPLAGWHGVVGLHHTQTDFEAIGDEAFTPANESQQLALYVVEEKRVGEVTLQMGGRYEHAELEALSAVTVELHHEEGEPEPEPFFLPEQDFSSLSLSAGAVWRYRDGYSLALSLTHAERAPSHQELFSAGAHIATRTYDLGLAFSLDENDEVLVNDDIREEVSNNLDITWRKFEGRLDLALSVFFNQVNDYIVQEDTGLEAEHGHEEGEGGVEPAPEEPGIPVFHFVQEDAKLYGAEVELGFDFTEQLSLRLFGDLIRAKLDSGNLPRIPPLRIGSSINYERGPWSADLGATWYDEQDNVASFESASNGYTLVDANLAYTFAHHLRQWTLYLKGHNLSDEEARPHTSFIKDLAPMPGRGVAIGLRVAL